jgi:hypothetical protein
MRPEYFKRSLRPYEAEAYIKGVGMRDRAGYNQARMICNMWRSEESEPIVFPWENKEEVINASKPKPPTREEIDSVREWAAQATEMLNKKTNGRKCDCSETTT